MRRRPPVHAALAVCTLLTGTAPAAAEWDGRLVVEMEYLGEFYFSEQSFDADDLGLPDDTPILFTDTTRFTSDTWLPGQRLDLTWRRGDALGPRTELTSRTGFTRERLSQDLEFLAELPGQTKGVWRFRVDAALREEERSLVGHGDWRTRVEATREAPLSETVDGLFRLGWEHSRTRGDSTSYLYDYDLLRVRTGLTWGAGWLPAWEARLEGRLKEVPRAEPGGYRELRGSVGWRPEPGVRSVNLEARLRDYEIDDAVGRDLRSLELELKQRLAGTRSLSLKLETRLEGTDYDGEDELYYDSAEWQAHLPLQTAWNGWELSAGPAARLLWDISDGSRDFRQWTWRTGAGRLVSAGGFAELSLEVGHRNYLSGGADVIEVSSLSSSILRSDYWLVDALALLNLPVWGGVSVDLVASTSYEQHRGESERIHITFVTLGLSRGF